MGRYILLAWMLLFSLQGYAAAEGPEGEGLKTGAPTRTVVRSPSANDLERDLGLKRMAHEIVGEYGNAGLSVLWYFCSDAMALLELVPVGIMAHNHPWLASRIGGLVLADPLLRVLGEEYRTGYRAHILKLDLINRLLQVAGASMIVWSLRNWLTGEEGSAGTWGRGLLVASMLDCVLGNYKSGSDFIRTNMSVYTRYYNAYNSTTMIVGLLFMMVVDSLLF